MGEKGGFWESEWDSCGVRMDVKWEEALDEICGSLCFFWMEFNYMPLSISQYVSLFLTYDFDIDHDFVVINNKSLIIGWWCSHNNYQFDSTILVV